MYIHALGCRMRPLGRCSPTRSYSNISIKAQGEPDIVNGIERNGILGFRKLTRQSEDSFQIK
jgi:hypothetical protein